MLKKIGLFILSLLILSSMVMAKEKITIFHAGSLAVPFKNMDEAFMKKYPQYEVMREASGSTAAARKISELKRQAEVMASADYRVIDNILRPENADWNVMFARNRMVIAFNEHSKYAEEITPDNWIEVIIKKGVNYGHSDPNLDPCGYRSLMVWQLAEKHYNKPGLFKKLDSLRPKKNIRPKETDLLAMMETGELDYMFQYESVAKQHSFKYINLPVEIDLSSLEYADFYKNAKVEVTGAKPGTFKAMVGGPILYGITVPKNAENSKAGLRYVEFVLSKEGQEIMKKSQQLPIVPAESFDYDILPKSIKKLVIAKKK